MPAPRRIGRRDVERTLLRWQSGEMPAVQVQRWAEELYLADDVEHDDWEHDGEERFSVTHTALGVLETLGVNLVTVDDVPALLDFLGSRRGYYHPRERRLRRLLQEVDHDARRRALRDTPPYAAHIALLDGGD